MVHDEIVLQQLILKNKAAQPVDFSYSLNTVMLIRDLDHLDPTYFFNESRDEGYTYIPGPNGYSHVCVHELDTQSQPEANAIACVTTLFIDGKAVKTHYQAESNDILEAKVFSSKIDIKSEKPVEIVVAYKMILLPTSQANWSNFIITANEADVNKFLDEVPKFNLRSDEDDPLYSLGLSMIDPEEVVGNAAEQMNAGPRGDKSLDRGSQTALDGVAGFKSKQSEGFVATNRGTGATEISASKDGEIGRPSGIPRNTSSKNHIEYLAWRHLEHILSVCAVPTSAPAPLKDNRNPPGDTPSPPEGAPNLPNSDDIAPVALTCGDMSCHRIFTSASL